MRRKKPVAYNLFFISYFKAVNENKLFKVAYEKQVIKISLCTKHTSSSL